MVDPNPARGMPIALQRYWLTGKGAVKIRWGAPHDFNRCVRNLRKYFPKNPEGLCNILHRKALGAPPGKGHAHSLVASFAADYTDMERVKATELLDKMPELGQYLWAGPLAPIGRPTSEPRRTRVFEHGALMHRMLPLPLDWREHQAPGHTGGMTVGRILGVMYGPNEAGIDFCWGWGDFLDEEIIPEARKARHLIEKGVAGVSLDPGGTVIATIDPQTGWEHMGQFVIGGATLVSVPAFDQMRLCLLNDEGDMPDDDMDMVMDLIEGEEEDCGCTEAEYVSMPPMPTMPTYAAEFTVNTSGWRGLPLAPRESVFDNDDAVKRIQAWATDPNTGQVDVSKLQKAFMWHDATQPPTMTTSYRLPVGDIINGKLTLIYHAVYAAAALISGAHGGLPDIPDPDKAELRNVISEIYPEMSKEFNDPSIRAPWDRSAHEGVQLAMDDDKKEPYGDVDYADPGYRDGTKRYPIDSPDHIRAAWSYINVAKNAAFYNAKQLAAIKAKIKAAAKKHGIEISDPQAEASSMPSKDEYSVSETGYPLTPPREWFDKPNLKKATPLTVTPEGRVFGHLALWDQCHRDVTMRECVMAPRSEHEYAPFHLGSVVTAEGDTLAVGKIVMDTRHADIRMRYASAALHYDNTGDEVAVVRAYDGDLGVEFAGSIVPEADPRKVAKLRRSPLSGDWRRERGSLELTAALAVNAPAFPVYSMEGEERMALVAAGSVMPEPEDDTLVVEAPTAINFSALLDEVIDKVRANVQDDDHEEELEYRRQRLADIRSDDEILDVRARDQRLARLKGASA